MSKSIVLVVATVGLVGAGGLAFGAPVDSGKSDPQGVPKTAPHEPIGFIAGGVVGAAAAGPIGAVVGAGLGTWLGNRVHRASDAGKAEAALAEQRREGMRLAEANRALTVQVAQLTTSVNAMQLAKADPAEALDGLQGDVLFRTGSSEIEPQTAHQIQTLAQAMAKSPELKIRVDGYADPRGSVEANLKLSQARADAVRDLLLASGVAEKSLEVNAYGKTQSVADDDDGFALERRVRLTLQAQGGQVAKDLVPAGGAGGSDSSR